MAKKKLPYYPMYVEDFDDDEKVIEMSLGEVGLYILSMNSSWRWGSIPDEPKELSRLIRKGQGEVVRNWPKVRACFIQNGSPGRLVNPRQERERIKAIDKSRKATDSVRSRYETDTNVDTNEPTDVDTGASTNVDIRASESVSKSEKTNKSSFSEAVRLGWFRDEFWPVVWRKIGAGAARKAWLVKVHTVELKDIVIAAAILQGPEIIARAQRSGGTVLHPATWLNQERWEDESEPLLAPLLPQRHSVMDGVTEEMLND